MRKIFGVLAAFAVVMYAGSAYAQAPTANVTVTANVGAHAKLTVGSTDVGFEDTDPDTTLVTTTDVLTIDVKGRFGTSMTLAVKAGGPLTDGTKTIPIGNVDWTATGDGFADGTLSTSSIDLGTWGASGSYSGTQTYRLANSWDYATGTYKATVTYTLTVS